MLLRRVIEHVKAQNWMAVGIDFVIVVFGVFIGIQVSNWNDGRQERVSERQYLDRFAEDLELTIAHIEEERAFSGSALSSIENFATHLFEDGVSDEVLVSSTGKYLSTGAFFANFKPRRTTFDDLIATGNFEIVGDQEIRNRLVRLHAQYDTAATSFATNIEWIQLGEPRIYYDFDAFRYDPRTVALFDEATAAQLANDVREKRDVLRRHAAFHYWLKVRSVELYDEIEPEAQSVLELINASRGYSKMR